MAHLTKINSELYVNPDYVDSVYREGDTYYIETQQNRFMISEKEFLTYIQKFWT